MRKTIPTAALVLGLLGGAVGGVTLAVPSVAGAETTSDVDRSHWVGEALAKLVDDGTITQAQADAVAEALRAARPRHRPFFRGLVLAVAADAIGIDASELRSQLEDGKTIAQVASDHGVGADAVVDALVGRLESRLEDAVNAGRITQDQADERLARAREHFTDLVNGELPKPPDEMV